MDRTDGPGRGPRRTGPGAKALSSTVCPLRGSGLISGAHAIIYRSDAAADRALLKDVLGLPSVDAGEGWLILALPPTELAVHPAEEGKPGQEIYLLADDTSTAPFFG